MTPVTLTFPASSVNVALARSVAAAMAARADLTLDRLEDVRLAVDEAVSQLLGGTAPDSTISCRFVLAADRLEIVVSGPWSPRTAPSAATFGWMVMNALCDQVTAHLADGTLSLTLAVLRTAPAEA